MPGHQDGYQEGCGASGARGTNTPSVSSTARLVCFSWRGSPARRRITAASRPFPSLRAGNEGLRRSTAPVVQADREHVTIAGRPAGLGRSAAQAVAFLAEPAHGNDIGTAATTEPRPGPPLLPRRRRGNDRTRAPGALMGHSIGQPVWRGKPNCFRLPRMP